MAAVAHRRLAEDVDRGGASGVGPGVLRLGVVRLEHAQVRGRDPARAEVHAFALRALDGTGFGEAVDLFEQVQVGGHGLSVAATVDKRGRAAPALSASVARNSAPATEPGEPWPP